MYSNYTDHIIYKVKRTSDNETFTIGDGVKLDIVSWSSNDTYLKAIRLTSKGIQFNIKQNKECGWYKEYKFKEFITFKPFEKSNYSFHNIIDKIETCKNRFSFHKGGDYISVDELIQRLKYDKT